MLVPLSLSQAFGATTLSPGEMQRSFCFGAQLGPRCKPLAQHCEGKSVYMCRVVHAETEASGRLPGEGFDAVHIGGMQVHQEVAQEERPRRS